MPIATNDNAPVSTWGDWLSAVENAYRDSLPRSALFPYSEMARLLRKIRHLMRESGRHDRKIPQESRALAARVVFRLKCGHRAEATSHLRTVHGALVREREAARFGVPEEALEPKGNPAVVTVAPAVVARVPEGELVLSVGETHGGRTATQGRPGLTTWAKLSPHALRLEGVTRTGSPFSIVVGKHSEAATKSGRTAELLIAALERPTHEREWRHLWPKGQQYHAAKGDNVRTTVAKALKDVPFLKGIISVNRLGIEVLGDAVPKHVST